MLDYGSPSRFEPTSKKRGVGTHPHRGFETVTIAFQGEVEHGDSLGNKGMIGPGGISTLIYSIISSPLFPYNSISNNIYVY